jgi:hypothetical protein
MFPQKEEGKKTKFRKVPTNQCKKHRKKLSLLIIKYLDQGSFD